MRKAPVNDHDNLKRDLDSGAIVNTDHVSYERYMVEKNSRIRQQNEIIHLKEEIEILKAMIRDK
tara:strand:+ start:24731 stop:24922 length:192 start_codon:yes stop_codon:yes gene_type:complete